MEIVSTDIWIGRALRELGEHCQGEIDFLETLIRCRCPHGGIAIDAGAYIGDTTLPLSRLCTWVHAFEPQAEIREILLRNLERNHIHNVTVYPYALGHESKVLSYDVDPAQPGGTTMFNSNGAEPTSMVTLDSLNLSRVDLLKADVEGMEALVLLGATQTIATSQPIIFMERDTVIVHGIPTHEAILEELNYTSKKCSFPFWSQENFRGATENTFDVTGSLMTLAYPTTR